ncbi:hypothetical protein [Chryseosolibacter indicus]|uniref:Uncharacterized protein n=1 Tax=Chryseosolibacter indicus TaxID=2782351 RepID=A0ABS5VPN7_9BACT|nr:hypothetical protein [Chryseosolibacter indicus]MBT1702824.1 hypothetical protein [Chryseosolibacter indicus]
MAAIHLKQPYKILSHKIKRYTNHYSIPADACVIIPLKSYGDEVACEVRWEDDNGELQVKESLIFTSENLQPINKFINSSLYELWEHYYGPNSANN